MPFTLGNISLDSLGETCPSQYSMDQNTTVAIICTDGFSHYNVSYHHLIENVVEIKTTTPKRSQDDYPEYVREGLPYSKSSDWNCDQLPVKFNGFYPQ